jgi:hypothetical protein
MSDASRLKRRRWADIAVIVASCFAIVWGIWTPPTPSPEIHDASWWWGTTFGGALGLLSVFIALKSTLLGRIALGAAVAILFGALLTMHTLSWIVLLTVGLPALVMLVALPFFGPMPTPEQEGEVRRGI